MVMNNTSQHIAALLQEQLWKHGFELDEDDEDEDEEKNEEMDEDEDEF